MAKTTSIGVSLGLGAAILYLGAHAVTGHQGLAAYVDLQAQEEALTQRLAALEAERADLQARAERLQPGTLDRDYLDEQARLLLGAGEADEVVFALNGNGAPAP